MKVRTHKELMKIALSRKSVKREYDALEEEFVVIKTSLQAEKIVEEAIEVIELITFVSPQNVRARG
jgi:hypothetical protein